MRKPSESTPPPPECANCGAAIPPQARACPECGADERTGWREAGLYDGLDLPEEAFDDPTSTRLGRGQPPARQMHGLPWYWWCVGIGLAAVLVLGALALL